MRLLSVSCTFLKKLMGYHFSILTTLETSFCYKLNRRERNAFPCPLINILSWMISRWNKGGAWKCSRETTLWKFQHSSWRDIWKRRKTMKGCSHQYSHKCKICPFFLINISGGGQWDWKSIHEGGMMWDCPSSWKEQRKINDRKNEMYYAVTQWVQEVVL